MYYFIVNRQNEIINCCQIKSKTDKNIEATEEQYNNFKNYGIDYYIYDNEKIIKNSEYAKIELQTKKQEKIAKNDILRDDKLIEGVEYNNVLFDSDTDQKTNLLATYQMLSDEDTITWYGKDNKALLCTKNDLLAIGQLIIQLHSYCWNMNAYIKEQIDNATNLEELEQIKIDYEVILNE